MTCAESYNGLKHRLLNKYFGFLNEKQREAVYSTEGPLLVLAGAGSGKTTVIVNRIANIILFGSAATDDTIPENADLLIPQMHSALESGNRDQIRDILKSCAVRPAFPYRVLCITFTNKAAREFKERLSGALGECADDIWAGTFHSICVRILRRYIDKLGYNNDFTIYDTDDCKKLLTSVIKDLNIPENSLPIRLAMSQISRAKENHQTPDEFALSVGKDRLLTRIAEVYAEYQVRLQAANALDFDDIIMLTNRLFEAYPDVLERYQTQFEYILVDEYQDTNPSQSRLVNLLAGYKQNVCVVGDDDQSIYSFRGATVDNILGFDTEYSNVKTIRLEQNYRSTENILSAANGIIRNNQSRKGKELWTEAGKGEKVHLKFVYTQVEESDFICNTIAQKVRSGARYSDFAILYRVNAISGSLETAFVKHKIPYKIFGGLRFYERREIKDMLAYLSVINNGSDSVRLRRIINLPKRSIGDATVDKIAKIADECNVSMLNVISSARNFGELNRSAQRLEQFAALINELRDYSISNPISSLILRVFEKTGYKNMLADDENGKEREENILELVSAAKTFEETAKEATLAEFLNEIALVSDLDSYEENADAVVLMTVHSAKGLEFPTVFIAGFEEGMFPSSQSFNEGTFGLEEERRLAYVAVTRAKKELFLVCTANRMVYGRTEVRQPSRFVSEMPTDSYDKQNLGGGRSQSSYVASPSQVRENHNDYLSRVRESQRAQVKATDCFSAGDTVSHAIFGKGQILSATPMGGDVLYEIEFDSGSVKRIMGNFAKLKKI